MKNATENIFSKKELVDAFTAMDLDGGGTIQATELLNMSQETMDAKHLQMLLREADEVLESLTSTFVVSARPYASGRMGMGRSPSRNTWL